MIINFLIIIQEKMVNLLNDLAAKVKDIAYKLNLISDYVVEQGETGIWTYRKWNSGIAECWGTYDGTVNLTLSMAGVYYSSTIVVEFPFTFTSEPSTIVSGGSVSTVNWARSFSRYTDKASFIVTAIQKQSGVRCVVNLYSLGRWK